MINSSEEMMTTDEWRVKLLIALLKHTFQVFILYTSGYLRLQMNNRGNIFETTDILR